MPIPFTCPHCGKKTIVADQYAGTSGPCAGCGQTITVPGKAGTVTPGPFAAAPSSAAARRSGSGTPLVIALVVGGVCIVGLAVAGILVALLLPAVSSAREAARRMQCMNNLKQIALAMHNYHDTYKCFPAAYITDEDGKPMHSWRVALLPFLEAAPLYDQYNFDEPWDSANNMAVAQRMPEVFRCPSDDASTNPNCTNYVVVMGDPDKFPETAFAPNKWARMRDFKDGLSNTILVVETSEPVPWTKPDANLDFHNMSYRIGQIAGSIGSHHPGGANVAMADGAVTFLSEDIDPNQLRSMLQPADGGQPFRW